MVVLKFNKYAEIMQRLWGKLQCVMTCDGNVFYLIKFIFYIVI